MSDPKVFFINRYFYPDHSATAQILSDVVFHLNAEGKEISVITSREQYDGGEQLASFENINGVDVIRVATTRFGRANLIGRAFDYLSFYVSAFFCILKNVAKRDVVIVKTDPPLLSVPLGVALWLKGAVRINWLQDLYPETAGALGVGFAKGFIGNILRASRNRSLIRAKTNVVIGEIMGELLERNNVPKSKIYFIPNFSDDEKITPQSYDNRTIRDEWGFKEDDFVICYSGNLGRAHDVETVLGAAKKLESEPKIKFLFVGGGHLRKTLEERISALDLTNILLKPYQPREKLAQSLGAADMHWLSLRPELEGLIVPSKAYGVAAAGRGLICVGDTDGEIARAVKSGNFGLAVNIGDSDTLANNILALSMDKECVQKYGYNARLWLENNARKQDVLASWSDMLKS